MQEITSGFRIWDRSKHSPAIETIYIYIYIGPLQTSCLGNQTNKQTIKQPNMCGLLHECIPTCDVGGSCAVLFEFEARSICAKRLFSHSNFCSKLLNLYCKSSKKGPTSPEPPLRFLKSNCKIAASKDI